MGQKNIYEKEIKKLKEHRKLYFPAMQKILRYYEDRNRFEGYIEITDKDDILILAELIDIEYIDGKTVIVKKYFEDIDKVVYTKEYPFTLKGDHFLETELLTLGKKIKKYRIFAYIIIIIMSLITIILLLIQ